MSAHTSWEWYEAHAGSVVPAYEAAQPQSLHAWLLDLLPAPPAVVLDVGAGSGRDAAWLASLGHEVVAAEPAAAMRAEAVRLHPDPRIRWTDDALPDLACVLHAGLSFDLVLASAVWQHLAPPVRARAFRKIVTALKPGALLALTLRHGPDTAGRDTYPVSAEEIEALGRDHGLITVRRVTTGDALGREGVSWTCLAFRLPDDGTGALPLLRHVILNDQKQSTYKLGLLRALCRAADGAAGLAEEDGEGFVSLPLGLVALNWLRLYLPLVSARLPQAPGNAGPDRLGFAGPGFRALLAGAVPAADLRVGARLSGAAAAALHAALRDAAWTVADMPATYMTYPNGGPVLPVERGRPGRPPEAVLIDAAYLRSFGRIHIPAHLWRALGRFACWVEPSLVAEWVRLMGVYAARAGLPLDGAAAAAAMAWSDPERDVLVPRRIALGLVEQGRLHCAWTGRRLEASTLDIDHLFPWSAWPCGDLWNLLPAHREVNQRLKRDRLPSAPALATAEDRILGWWRTAYLAPDNLALPVQFGHEARASLPGLRSADAESLDPGRVYDAVRLQQVRLRQDQGVPEWRT